MKKNFVSKIFWWVANALQRISKATHLTYNEINVILYYFIIPLVWCIMLDCIIKLPIFTIVLIVSWSVIGYCNRKDFSEWCDRIFKLSQQFIMYFGEYKLWSVVICVIIPLAFTFLLIYNLLTL